GRGHRPAAGRPGRVRHRPRPDLARGGGHARLAARRACRRRPGAAGGPPRRRAGPAQAGAPHRVTSAQTRVPRPDAWPYPWTVRLGPYAARPATRRPKPHNRTSPPNVTTGRTAGDTTEHSIRTADEQAFLGVAQQVRGPGDQAAVTEADVVPAAGGGADLEAGVPVIAAACDA